MIEAETADRWCDYQPNHMLQWGRLVIEAETGVVVEERPHMGASMGPPRDRGGDVWPASATRKPGLLQWGRLVIEAETCSCRRGNATT